MRQAERLETDGFALMEKHDAAGVVIIMIDGKDPDESHGAVMIPDGLQKTTLQHVQKLCRVLEERVEEEEAKYRLPSSACPECGNECSGATAVVGDKPGNRKQPKPGDVSVCLYCATQLQFDKYMRVERLDRSRLNAEELAAVDEARAKVELFHAHLKRKGVNPRDRR